MDGPRRWHIRELFEQMREHLQVGGVAHIALGLNPPGTNRGTKGHVLLAHRSSPNEYAVFDPNNGVMSYSNRRDMEAALRRYMNEAFTDTGMQLTPDAVQYYSILGPSNSVSAHDVPARPPTRPEVPLTASAQSESKTRDALRASADESNSLSSDTLSGAAGRPDALTGRDRGLATAALSDIAQGHSSNLSDATENIRRRLTDTQLRSVTLREIDDMQRDNGSGVVEPLPGYARRRGSARILSAANLIVDVREHFNSLHVNQDTGVGYPTDLAVINLATRERPAGIGGSANARAGTRADGEPIVVHRLNQIDNYASDRYELYDPGSGVWRYDGFEEMASALRGVFDRGYHALGGVDHADTSYYANLSRPMAAAGGSAPARLAIANLNLGQIEQLLGILNARPGVIPRPDLSPPPFSIVPKHDPRDLKRWATSPIPLKPDGVFRPSTVTPQDLKTHGGFDCERTHVSDINLGVHNLDVASNPHLIDSAGYLGTFRSERTALDRFPAQSGDGYIYFIAPTPNMVDVAGSLGSQMHAPWDGEVAAMGWIDYPQIRGWRVVKNGVPGQYVANPDYRWDVYDHTGMAGAQPQLSRLPVDHPIWREDGYNAYVSDNRKDGGTLKFNEDPNVTHALFYDAAWEKVRELNKRQAADLDYRGPLRLHAYGSGDRSRSEIYLDGQNNVYVNTMFSPSSTGTGTQHDFAFADDGRFHVIGNTRKVLQVDSNGYVYAGDAPDDPNSLNGVFEYDGKHLVHQEDMKLLTTGLSSFTPFVDSNLHGERSEWHLRTPDGKDVSPPRVNMHTFRQGTSASAQQLYAFYQDPDVALPRSATHFVTRVPDNAYSGNFLDYVKRITAEEARDASNWLRTHNAAWLFNDGFYATANGPDVLEVRRLDGIPVWQAEGVNSDPRKVSHVEFKTLLPLSSTYRMPDETKQRLAAREARRSRGLSLVTTPMPAAA
jgi:hypothetical protein